MASLPEKIKICGVVFKVVQVPVVSKDEPRKGEINYLSCVIKIDESMPDDLKRQVLMHEIFHAVCDLTGNYDIGENENAVQGISTAIYCVLSENKSLCFL